MRVAWNAWNNNTPIVDYKWGGTKQSFEEYILTFLRSDSPQVVFQIPCLCNLSITCLSRSRSQIAPPPTLSFTHKHLYKVNIRAYKLTCVLNKLYNSVSCIHYANVLLPVLHHCLPYFTFYPSSSITGRKSRSEATEVVPSFPWTAHVTFSSWT